ncbi:MAG: tubulin-like doman-containing protein [Verrucomicrobiota bacterium]
MNEIEKFITSVLESSRQAPEGQYYPALVVGLGGTGCRILRHLKRRLSDPDLKRIRLLGIDSDTSENSKFTTELPALADSELVLLHAPTAIGVLERAAAGHTAEAHVLEYLPPKFHSLVKEKINSNKGAGQFRRAGRLLFCSNVSNGANLGNRLMRIKQDLAGLAAVVGQLRQGVQIVLGVRVYVVASLVGGTGAGSMIDCLALLRRHFSDQNDVITGAFVLPGELFDRELSNPYIEKRQTRANALGVLRELQAFLVPHDGINAFDPTRHEFVFDVDNRGPLGTNTLINDVYLVDHRTKDGRLASDIGDVCRAVSLFIYSLVGSGVGASKDSGIINGRIDMLDPATRKSAEPQVFNGFGVGVIEYPVDELLHFAVRLSLEQRLQQWLSSGKGPKGTETEPDVAGMLASFGLADLTAARRALTQEGSVPQMTPNWREATLKLNDADFFEAIMRFRQNVERDLTDLQSSSVALADHQAGTIVAGIDLRAREWTSSGLSAALSGLAGIRRHVANLEASRQKETGDRDLRKVELQKGLTMRAKFINFIDLGFDKKLRRSYLDDISELVQMAWHDSLDVNLSGLLDALDRKVAEIELHVDQLKDQVKTFVTTNSASIKEIEDSQSQSCFVQSVLKPAEFRNWVAANLVMTATVAPLAGFQLKDLLTAILEPLLPNFRLRLESLNLKAESEQNKVIEAAVRATEYISQALVHLIPSAPPDSAMIPQHYVAGDFLAQNDPYVGKMFSSQAGERATQALPTGDRRRMVCVSTISGFAAAHWRGFDLAEGYYRESPWHYHVWPDPDTLPEIRPLDRNELALNRDFGLAMLFDMTVSRGANFYRNLANDPVQNIATYLIYKDQWGQPATALLALRPELARQAPTDRRKPAKDTLLGESLSKAIESFIKSTQGSFRQLVIETVDEFVERVGRVEMKRLLDEFIDQELAAQLTKAVEDSDRKRSLEEIRAALRKYAAQLA